MGAMPCFGRAGALDLPCFPWCPKVSTPWSAPGAVPGPGFVRSCPQVLQHVPASSNPNSALRCADQRSQTHVWRLCGQSRYFTPSRRGCRSVVCCMGVRRSLPV
jgi:hypothetical protein